MTRTHLEAVNHRITAEYRTLHLMKSRCYRKTDPKYPRYGGRGIAMCDRWLNGDGIRTGVECFIADMGRRPSAKHSIDRINNDGNYEPSNCRWATTKEQARNTSKSRRLTIDGEQITLVEAAERFCLRYGLVKRRLQLGWSDEQAVGLAPPTPSKHHTRAYQAKMQSRPFQSRKAAT